MKNMMNVLLLALLMPGKTIDAQEKPDGYKAFEHVQLLASDEFKGRYSGTPEYRMAAEYVAAKMETYGLKPGANDGTYFQEAVFKNWSHWQQPIRLEILDPQHRTYFAGTQRDFFPIRGTGSGIIRGRLVFANTGVVCDSLNWDDYQKLDVAGRIVLIRSDLPDTLQGKERNAWTLDRKIRTAVERGAAGIIVMNIAPSSWGLRRIRLEKNTCPEGCVVMGVNTPFVDDAFYLAGKSWRQLVSKSIREKKPFTADLNITVEMEAHYAFTDSLTAPNVIGILPGRGRLREETLIIGGHLDHLGLGVDGFIYNGADDNAGAIGVILELARVFQANRFKPGRTLVFAGWAGEETGLVGSKYYVEHPVVPLEKTALYMNIDMVGCGDDDLYIGGMWEFSDLYDIIKAQMDDEMRGRLRYRLKYRGSDHAAFLRKGITSISLRTGHPLTRELDDEHPEYHRPGDMANIIDPGLLELSVRYHHDIITFLSHTRENLMDPMHHTQFVHKDATVADLHCDTISRAVKGEDLSKDLDHGHIDIPKLKQGAVDLQVFACYVAPPGDRDEKNQAAERALLQIDAVHRLIENHPDHLALVASYDNFRKLRSTFKTGILIGIEGGYAIENDLSLLRSFYRNGVRLMTLTHWTRTDWADASGDKEPRFGGLTELGEKVVKEMNRLGMIIDVSHAHDETFWDVLRITEAPVVASHSCCRALADHHRNLSDSMLVALAKNGGMIGINFAPSFLNSEYEKKENALRLEITKKHGLPHDYADLAKADPDKRAMAMAEYFERVDGLKRTAVPVTVGTVVDHIEHVIEITGSYDHVGLGSDFDGIGSTPVGLEHAGKLSGITKELLRRGHEEKDVKKILGDNFLRIVKEVCKGNM